MRPAQALDTHTLLAEVCAQPIARDYLGSLIEMSMHIKVDQDYVHTALCNHLRVADTYHVDERMADAVVAHAETLRPTSQYSDYQEPSACGVMVLDKPWDVIEVSGKVELVNLITWGPIHVGAGSNDRNPAPGYLFTLWQDTRFGVGDLITQAMREDRTISDTMRTQFGGLFPIWAGGSARRDRIGSYWHVVPEEKAAQLAAQGRPVAARLNAPLNNILATWDLMDQSIANLADEPVERAVRRRAKRLDIPQRVTVVTLRRNARSAETGTGTPLAWRVPVKPHSRTYWVRDPETGELVAEKRDIGLHWRGPLDAPVRVTEKVYTLRR